MSNIIRKRRESISDYHTCDFDYFCTGGNIAVIDLGYGIDNK